MVTNLRLAAVNGAPTAALADDLMAASFIALGESILAGKISIEQAIVVAIIDGSLTYTPFGHVTLVEGVGMMELASRKIERDMLER